MDRAVIPVWIPPELLARPIKRQYLPFIPAPPRFPGRTSIPISGGPIIFRGTISWIEQELRARNPLRWRQVIEYLPEIRYDPEELVRTHGRRFAADSGGLFGIDGSDFDGFYDTFLHEVGHNVAGHHCSPGSELRVTTREAQAHAYAEAVLHELGRKTAYPSGYDYHLYEQQPHQSSHRSPRHPQRRPPLRYRDVRSRRARC